MSCLSDPTAVSTLDKEGRDCHGALTGGISMQLPLQITVRHMAHSDALEARIQEDAAKLEDFYRGIVSCHVVVEQQGQHQRKGRWFNVRIAVRVPGHELVVNRDHDEDVYVALRDSFASLARRLEDVARRQHGQVKTHEPPV
jgi:ribosomal subunit interface protein